MLVSRAMRVWICFSFRYVRHYRVLSGGSLDVNFCGDALIDSAVLQFNVFCVGALIFETKTILHKSVVQYLSIGSILCLK